MYFQQKRFICYFFAFLKKFSNVVCLISLPYNLLNSRGGLRNLLGTNFHRLPKNLIDKMLKETLSFRYNFNRLPKHLIKNMLKETLNLSQSI